MANMEGQTENGEKLEQPGTFCEKVKVIINNITVEPLMLCYLMPSVMGALTIQNLNLEKACRVDLAYDDATCTAMALRDNSSYNATEEIAVQKLVASMAAWRNVLQSVFPCILLLFLGSWSDRRRRRLPCIYLPIIGEQVVMVSFLICTYFFYELPILANVFAEGLPAVTGGWTVMFLGVNAYVSDMSSLETRTLRIGALNLFTNICFPIGIALSGVLYVQIGFYGVFTLTLTLLTTGLIYGLIRVREVNHKEVEKNTDVGFFMDFFSIEHVMDTFKVSFKKRKNNKRAQILSVMVLIMLIIGPLHGEITVSYIFFRYKFHWNEIDFSMYLTFHFLAQLFGTAFTLIVLSKWLKMDDALIGVLSTVSKISACVMYTFAPSSVYIYLGALMESLAATSFVATRAMLSKMVPPDEIGKVFSLFGLCEALMPLVYGPLYSIVYRSTIEVFPSTFFILGATMTLPCLVIFWWLYMEHKREEKLEIELKKDSEATEMFLVKSNTNITAE